MQLESNFGHYEIQSRLGAGGMGEVYLAMDTRLDRHVALKVLPEVFASDEQRLRRFLHEAKVTSALKHPNIGYLYEVGECQGVYFLAMEYVEGPTLRALVADGPLGIDQLVDLGIEAAGALAEAHETGVLHRDIKPDNLMLDKRGRLKVLDFGLSRTDVKPASAGSAGETRLQALTEPGVVVGTPLYMSPEQAMGRSLDARSDLFSLGVVMYEMATGARPFEGKTSPEITNAILHQPVTAPVRLNPKIPVGFEHIILRCLEKEPCLRYQTASDLGADLKRLKRDSATDWRALPAIAPRARRNKLRIAVAVSVLAAAACAIAYFRSRSQAPPPELAEMTVRPLLASPTNESMPAFSPDGKMIAFTWDGEDGSNTDIYVKLLDAGNPLRLTTNPAADSFPVWSPDGRFIAFQRRVQANRTQVLIVPALGGLERKLLEQEDVPILGDYPMLSWDASGKSLAVAMHPDGEPAGIFLLDLESGHRRRLTSVPAGAVRDDSPAFSSDGKTLAFFRYRTTVTGSVALLSMENGSLRTIPLESWVRGLAWLPGAGLPGAGLPEERALLVGGSGGDAASGSERLIRLPLDTGKPVNVAIAGRGAIYPSVSPDGHRVVYAQGSADPNIWHASLETPTRMGKPQVWIASTRQETDPRYSPDGSHILFLSDRTGKRELWLSDSDGKNQQQLTTNTPAFGSPQWSPDGTHIVFDGQVEGNADIWIMDIAGGSAKRLTEDPSEDIVPSFSHDGQWVYFCSNRSGSQQLWRLPAVGGAAAQQITQDGGFDSQESRDGKYLYYTKGREKPGLVRRGLDGHEQMLLPKLLDRVWAATEKGVYYVDSSEREKRFRYLDIATGKTTVLMDVPHIFNPSTRSISLSPDEKNLLWGQFDSANSDLMLIENFR